MTREGSILVLTLLAISIRYIEDDYVVKSYMLLTIFFIIIALAVMFYEPTSFILPIGLAIITGYWLVKNNNAIKNEIEIR